MTDDESLDEDLTVAEIQAFITRARQALTEARRPDLAERCVVLIREDGRATVFFPNFADGDDDLSGAQEVVQFLNIDPQFGIRGDQG